ncbi:DUF932 domain-containing protein [Photobacterium kishitanii]|uniref:DUF932 domain-containing protein n=1 Tax=Photobacterium kishitanii TaxID=318456 RepID=A0A2T3KMN8_9GAMM|nr:DUF932 domain-containing protein [Photobacterium kishitanii]PSV01063.1 hypothetical protein C9J27_03330 [Photobacterium kishitanii]
MFSVNNIYNIEEFSNIEIGDTAEILNRADLDWQLMLKPCLYFNEKKELIVGSKRYLLLDRGNELVEMAVVGKDYKCVQPTQIIKIFQQIHKAVPMELLTAGHTRDGKYIYIIGKLLAHPKSRIEDICSLSRCLIVHVCNDGNGKMKATAVTINERTGSQMAALISEKATPVLFELSHHFDFDEKEAVYNIQTSIQDNFDAFNDELMLFSSVEISKIEIDEFIHQIFNRFNIGNDKTKRNYHRVTQELKEHFNIISKDQPFEVQNTALSLFMFFCDYLDFSKSRKGGKSGRIHAINFGADAVSKREAFRIVYKITNDKIKEGT